jgi:hypothetical protein
MRVMVLSTVGLLAIGGCQCSDPSFTTIPNDPPSVRILSHQNGDEVDEAYTITVRGSVNDDDPVEDLKVTWLSDGEVICEGAPSDEEGTTECEMVVPLSDPFTVLLEARDAEGEVVGKAVDLVVNPTDAPDVQITQPLVDGRYYANLDIPLEATVSDGEDEPTAITVSWISDRDGDVGTATGDITGRTATVTLLTEGTHQLEAWGVDSTGKTGMDSVTIEVGPPNSPPTCEIIWPTADEIISYDADILLTGMANDEDLPDEELVISWSSDVDGELATGNPSVDGVVENVAQVTVGYHTLTLSAIDDVGSECLAEVYVDASNSAPTAPIVDIEPSSPTALHDLLCVVEVDAVDAEDDPLTYEISWERDGFEYDGPTATTRLEGDTIAAENTAPGQVWVCRIVAFDGRVYGPAGEDTVLVEAPKVIQIAADSDHGCFIDTALTMQCWGSGALGARNLEGGFYQYVDVGTSHTCGLNWDGDVICDGYNNEGQTDTTGLVGPFTVLNSGTNYNCAIDTFGTLQCWGSNDYAQATPPAGVFTQVSAAFRHTCAIAVDGSPVCWGEDTYGRATPPPGVNFVDITAGKYHTCGVDDAGVLHCWGRNNHGQMFGPAGSYIDVAAGDTHTCGIMGDNSLHCWGEETDPGGLNDPPAGSFVSVIAGKMLSCAVDLVGAAHCWGEDSHGETSPPTEWW